jgi:hypothetical protein
MGTKPSSPRVGVSGQQVQRFVHIGMEGCAMGNGGGSQQDAPQGVGFPWTGRQPDRGGVFGSRSRICRLQELCTG